MNSASILPQPGPIYLPSWQGLAVAAIALDGGGRVQGAWPWPTALITSFPVTCRRGLQEICICNKDSAAKNKFKLPCHGDGELSYLPSFQFSHFPMQGYGSPRQSPPAWRDATAMEPLHGFLALRK